MTEIELGDKFDVKGVHDIILSGGVLPLELLERKVNALISTQK